MMTKGIRPNVVIAIKAEIPHEDGTVAVDKFLMTNVGSPEAMEVLDFYLAVGTSAITLANKMGASRLGKKAGDLIEKSSSDGVISADHTEIIYQ